jgi:hypothetical protein
MARLLPSMGQFDEYFFPFHCISLLDQRFCHKHIEAGRTLK